MDQPLTLEERVLVLEWLLDAALWGPYLYDLEHGRLVAASLYQRLEGAARHRSLPEAVLRELYLRADSLASIDNTPDSLRPALRQAVLPPAPPEENPGSPTS